MELVGYSENIKMLSELFPGRIVISMTECARVLGVDYRTVKDMTQRVKNPLPLVRLTEGPKSRCGVPVALFARWLCKKE